MVVAEVAVSFRPTPAAVKASVARDDSRAIFPGRIVSGLGKATEVKFLLKPPIGLLVIAVFLGAATLFYSGHEGSLQMRGAEIEAFLAQHWAYPLLPQGTPPSTYSEVEASLDARKCGQCHQQQFQDWSRSLHSHAMGPGILWQFSLMGQADANDCMRCHAPLAEQKGLMALEHGWDAAPARQRPAYVPEDLAYQGVTCAACHVRNHRRYGPPTRTQAGQAAPAPHAGFVESLAFGDSRFCATCHQFPDDGPKVNGKLREDTYRQWLTSEWAEKGITCQSCHMPDRRHHWRGIHSAEMVNQALAIDLDVRVKGMQAVAAATLKNVGAGHHFPTYLVPKVTATLELVGLDGKRQVLKREVIGWQVDVNLSQEHFDTRVPPGGELLIESMFPLPSTTGWRVDLHIDVAPREHYERMYQVMLAKDVDMKQQAQEQLKTAFAEARASRFRARTLSAPVIVVQD